MFNKTHQEDIGSAKAGIDVEQENCGAMLVNGSEESNMVDVINVVVYAENPENALYKAHEVMQNLGYIHHTGPFEFYDNFADEDFTYIDELKQYGKEPPGSTPPILQVSTTAFPTQDLRGVDLLNSIMEDYKEEFKGSLEQIRYLLAKYSPDELFDPDENRGTIRIEVEGKIIYDNPGNFKDRCAILCGHLTFGHKLYDFVGNQISRPDHLRRLLNPSPLNLLYFDKSFGTDPNWGPHLWNKPMWVVSFNFHPRVI